MEQSTTVQNKDDVRIGIIDCLYTAPITQLWKESVHRQEWLLKEMAIGELHSQIETRKIDIGFIPAFAYAQNTSEYKLLPGISISSAAAVGVGVLFSHFPFEQLAEKPVLLSSEKTSTAALTRIILEEWNKVTPQYILSEQEELNKEDVKAILASGDDALRLSEKPDFLYQFDLGDIWKRKMELPFVFAVCVARRDFCEEYPQTVQEIHQELLRCRDAGLADLPRVSELSAKKIPFSVDKCRSYLEGIRYELAGKERAALEDFMQLLISRQEITPEVLPLDFFICEQQEE